jgi:hypothetical protein
LRELARAGWVQALGKLGKTSFPAMNALLSFLNSPHRGYCRVRGMAAAALGEGAGNAQLKSPLKFKGPFETPYWVLRRCGPKLLAGTATNWMGLDLLLKQYRDRSFDPIVHRPRANDFTDLPGQLVAHAVVTTRGCWF